MQTVCTKEPVTIASVIHHMRKNTCTHPTTASHHYRHINRKRQISMSTYLRVPFSPLSRLVKRLYKRVIWLWETEGKKNKHISDSLQENTPLHQTTLPGDLNHGSSVFSLFLLLLEIISTTAFTSLLHIIQDTVNLSCSIITSLFFSFLPVGFFPPTFRWKSIVPRRWLGLTPDHFVFLLLQDCLNLNSLFILWLTKACCRLLGQWVWNWKVNF